MEIRKIGYPFLCAPGRLTVFHFKPSIWYPNRVALRVDCFLYIPQLQSLVWSVLSHLMEFTHISIWTFVFLLYTCTSTSTSRVFLCIWDPQLAILTIQSVNHTKSVSNEIHSISLESMKSPLTRTHKLRRTKPGTYTGPASEPIADSV